MINMKEINGRKIIGYSYADGVHWYWGDKEVAVINELRREIECVTEPLIFLSK